MNRLPKHDLPATRSQLRSRIWVLSSWVLSSWVLGGWILLASASTVAGQTIVTGLTPRTCPPGETTRLILQGKNFNESLRAATSRLDAQVVLESVTPDRAVVAVTLPRQADLGPLGIWLATQDGPLAQYGLLVDDLPISLDGPDNHQRTRAQDISTLACVDGLSQGPISDFYRIQVGSGQRVSFSVITQQINSRMDPVVRLMSADGRVIQEVDDSEVGPDCQFAVTFPQAGEYVLEVHDNHYAAGEPYHLRIGDFPMAGHVEPLAIQRGSTSDVILPLSSDLVGADGGVASAETVTIPLDFPDHQRWVAARTPHGRSSTWAAVTVSDIPVHSEPNVDRQTSAVTGEALTWPVAISGRLATPGQRDAFPVRGQKDRTVLITSRTRSVGCPALLKMTLRKSNGDSVAETSVGNTDEWQLEYKFPDDEAYTLEVTDLLGRGGADYGYLVQLQTPVPFAVSFKPEAATKQEFAIDVGSGVCAVDLTVKRSGYDGPIELQLETHNGGLHLVNPIIPAGSAEARVYIAANTAWHVGQAMGVKLTARQLDHPETEQRVGSLELHRIKQPSLPFPPSWIDGRLWLVATPPVGDFFALVPTEPWEFARGAKRLRGLLGVKRVQEGFQGPVTVIRGIRPAEWQSTSQIEKDQLTTVWIRPDGDTTEPEQVELVAFAEHQGRGRMATVSVPVRWVEPAEVRFDVPDRVVAGGSATITVELSRHRRATSPVQMKITGLPAGISATDVVEIPADQTRATVPLSVAADYSDTAPLRLGYEATGQFDGEPYTVRGAGPELAVLPAPQRLEIYPDTVVLSDRRDRQQLVVTGYNTANEPSDWTLDARITVANPELAEVRDGVIYPRADGDTQLVVELGPLKSVLPLRITGSAAIRPVAFESEVLVALSKQGCNSGACHGSPSGKGMFRLSLRAFDPQLDELTLIREDFGRRINPWEPARSLLLQKPLMQVSHGGGRRIREADEAYDLLKTWIAEGGHADPPGTARCEQLLVFPDAKRILRLKDGTQQLSAIARLTDGTRRDVTHLVAYESSNTTVATVDAHGRVTPRGRGETVILVRFLEHIETVPLMFIEDVPGFVWSAPTESNYVDTLVNDKLRQLQYLPAETCSDEEFVRRVYLDLLGILPTVEEADAFLADGSADKRARLIDQLLEREEFARFWALKWGDLLKITRQNLGEDGLHKYYRWVEESIRTNLPYDQFVAQLLMASGSTLAHPQASFFRTSADMNDCVENVSQLFLGVRLQCAKCHNHPFERWTQDNYYGLGAFFHRLQRRQTQRPGETFIWTADSGEVVQPRTGRPVQPWLPQAGSIEVAAGQDRRKALVAWLIAPENPFFARMEANRIWSQLFARGIVDPIDDFRDSNPPSNGPLLDALAADFVAHGYDRKHLLRVILNSRTYQASCRTNDFNQDDQLYFSHQAPRLLAAEQLLDAINQTVGVTQSFSPLPEGTRATQLPAPDLVKVGFLKTFGQPERSTVCACERGSDSNLGMALELFNGPTVHDKLRDPQNRFRRALAAGRPLDDILRELYLSAFSRRPAVAELAAALEHCQQQPDPAAGLEDVAWALVNSDEFLFQH